MSQAESSCASVEMQGRAVRRLMRDVRALEQEPVEGVAVKVDEQDALLVYVNMVPAEGHYAGLPTHLHLRFTEDYPARPPVVSLLSDLDDHPNVFGSYICLDMLKEGDYIAPYKGWSAAYDLAGILRQLYSFLLVDETLDQEWGGKYERIDPTEYLIRTTDRPRKGTCKCGFTHLPTVSLSNPSTGPSHNVRRRGGRGVVTLADFMPEINTTPPIRGNPSARSSAGPAAAAASAAGSNSGVVAQQQSQPAAVPELPTDVLRVVLGYAGDTTTAKLVASAAQPSQSQPQQPQQQPAASDPSSPSSSRVDIAATPASHSPSSSSVGTATPTTAGGAAATTSSASALPLRDELTRLAMERQRAQEQRCFYTKQPQDANTLLGLGVTVHLAPPAGKGNSSQRAPRGSGNNSKSGGASSGSGSNDLPPITGLSTTMDLLSYEAFKEDHVRRSAWNIRFHAFLPLALDTEHARRHALPALGPCLEAMTSRKTAVATARDPNMRLVTVLAQLMNSLVVEMVKSDPVSPPAATSNSHSRNTLYNATAATTAAAAASGSSSGQGLCARHMSDAALQVFCHLNHLLLSVVTLTQHGPRMLEGALADVRAFVRDPAARHKLRCPDLGVLLVKLLLVPSEAVPWSAFAPVFMRELLSRQVRWLPEMKGDWLRWVCADERNLTATRVLDGKQVEASQAWDAQRLAATFQGAKTSLRVVALEAWFANALARPRAQGTQAALAQLARIRATYDATGGTPPPGVFERFHAHAHSVLGFSKWTEVLAALRLGIWVGEEATASTATTTTATAATKPAGGPAAVASGKTGNMMKLARGSGSAAANTATVKPAGSSAGAASSNARGNGVMKPSQVFANVLRQATLDSCRAGYHSKPFGALDLAHDFNYEQWNVAKPPLAVISNAW